MPAYKDKNGTWYVMARYTDWTGEKKQKCQRGFITRREALEWEAQFKLSELRIATNMGSFPVVIKEALNMISYNVGKCAEPIQPLTAEQHSKLEGVMRNIGLLK